MRVASLGNCDVSLKSDGAIVPAAAHSVATVAARAGTKLPTAEGILSLLSHSFLSVNHSIPDATFSVHF